MNTTAIRKPASFRLPQDLLEALKERAKASNRSLNNLVKATFAALSEMRDAYQIAGERGIAMDKVFNG